MKTRESLKAGPGAVTKSASLNDCFLERSGALGHPLPVPQRLSDYSSLVHGEDDTSGGRALPVRAASDGILSVHARRTDDADG